MKPGVDLFTIKEVDASFEIERYWIFPPRVTSRIQSFLAARTDDDLKSLSSQDSMSDCGSESSVDNEPLMLSEDPQFIQHVANLINSKGIAASE